MAEVFTSAEEIPELSLVVPGAVGGRMDSDASFETTEC